MVDLGIEIISLVELGIVQCVHCRSG